MSSTHQAKRPYAGSQPTLTSYFPQSHGPSNPSHAKSTYSIPSAQPHEDVHGPQLPHHVQSNLLSVGMRVRKSVPEGYKTGSVYSGFSLFADTKAPPASETQAAVRKPARSRARELTPFCGILKVGGLAMQQWGIYDPSGTLGRNDLEEDEELAEDDVPFLSSQGSTLSNFSVESVYSIGNKRRFDGDDEDVDEDVAIQGVGQRVIAVPRRRNWGRGDSGHVLAHQKSIGISNGSGDNDFGDAEFLDYALAEEVEMSGI